MWKDITSRSRKHEETYTPCTWEFKASVSRIVVTRWIYGSKSAWYLDAPCAEYEKFELEAEDGDAAKDEALGLVRKRLMQSLAAVEEHFKRDPACEGGHCQIKK